MADPDVILSVKKAVKENFDEVEILEYSPDGRSYPEFWNSIKDDIDLVICIPPNKVSHSNGEQRIYVGRGNHSECTTASKAIVRVVAFDDFSDKNLDWRNLECIEKPQWEVIEENWQNAWAYCTGTRELLF